MLRRNGCNEHRTFVAEGDWWVWSAQGLEADVRSGSLSTADRGAATDGRDMPGYDGLESQSYRRLVAVTDVP